MDAYRSNTEMDLYGVELGFIAIIMTFVSLVFPIGFVFQEGITPISLIFALVYPLPGLPLTILNILYAYWIIRFYQNRTTKNTVLILGLLSIILPNVFVLVITGVMGSPLFIYPFPIQFITGIVIIWKVQRPEWVSLGSGTAPELFGVSPNMISVLMILVTLIVPLGYIPPGLGTQFLFGSNPIAGVYGLIWLFGYGFSLDTGFHIFDSAILEQTLILGMFNILFALQLVRYYQGVTSRRRVLVVGVLSIVYPTLLVLITTVLLLPLSMIQIVWSIPVQFVIGLILLYRIPGPELVI